MTDREYTEAIERRMEEIESEALRHRLHEWLEGSRANFRELTQAYMHGIVDALNYAATLTELLNERDPLTIAGVLRAIAGQKEDRFPEVFRQLRFGDERLYSREVLYRVIPGCSPNKLGAMARRHAIAPDVELPELPHCVGYRWQTVQTAFDLSEEWRSRLDETADALEREQDSDASFRQMELDDHVRQKRLALGWPLPPGLVMEQT